MGRLIDADHVKDFFFSETSGTEDVIRDLMDTHGLDYANDINEEVIMAFAKDLLKAVQNVIDTEPIAYDPDKVVEQLEKLKKAEQDRSDDCDEDGNGDAEQIYDDGRSQGRFEAFGKAIELVKGGGVDEN